MNYPKVSIIILNWNELKDTIECLESLKKITYPNYEAIVVDNGSKGNDADILEKKYKDYIRLIRNKENLGFAEGNNIAMRQILKENKSDYILLLNNDTVVDPNFLTELVKVAESNPKIGSIGPDIRLYSNKKPQIKKYGRMKNITETNTLSGACLMLRSNVLKKIGLLDTIYFLYYEDEDINMRIKKANYKVVYLPTLAKVYHKLGNSTNKISGLQIYYMTRNRFLIVRRYMMNWKGLKLLLVEILKNLLKEILIKRDFKVLVDFSRGILDGILLFFKNPKQNIYHDKKNISIHNNT